MNKPKLRWGILGAANIARKNWKAIWNSGNGRIAAVASRDLERSRRFIAACQRQARFEPVPRALGSYEELLASPEIDSVYVPLPTGARGSWVKRAAEAGKHIVCEKPCGTDVAELKELLETCRANQVQFMDGVMFMHSRRLERLRQLFDDGQTIGQIRRIASAFSFRADNDFFDTNVRAFSELEPHGCLGDLGWYCIRLALWAMNWQLPVRVSGHLLAEYKHRDSAQAVPTEFSGELFFQAAISSSFYCSFLTENEQWAIVSGTRGQLRLADFVLPFSGTQTGFETASPVFEVKGCDFEMQPHVRRWQIKECSHSDPSAQEARLFTNFADQVQSGNLNEAWPEMALKTQQVMEACRKSARLDGQMTAVQ